MLGVDDLVVVTTPDAVLVLPRSRAEEVKNIVAALKARNVPEAMNHRRVYRPWGHYEGVDQGERFQVKRIVVTPGSTLSLQKHMHRAEHWVVVRGTAAVTIGEEQRTVHENEFDLYPDGRRSSARQSGPHSARTGRGSNRVIPGRRRHRAPRRRLRTRGRFNPAQIRGRQRLLRLLGDRPAGVVFTDLHTKSGVITHVPTFSGGMAYPAGVCY